MADSSCNETCSALQTTDSTSFTPATRLTADLVSFFFLIYIYLSNAIEDNLYIGDTSLIL